MLLLDAMNGREADIDFSDPQTLICYQTFKAKTPLVTDEGDLKKINVP